MVSNKKNALSDLNLSLPTMTAGMQSLGQPTTTAIADLMYIKDGIANSLDPEKELVEKIKSRLKTILESTDPDEVKRASEYIVHLLDYKVALGGTSQILKKISPEFRTEKSPIDRIESVKKCIKSAFAQFSRNQKIALFENIYRAGLLTSLVEIYGSGDLQLPPEEKGIFRIWLKKKISYKGRSKNKNGDDQDLIEADDESINLNTELLQENGIAIVEIENLLPFGDTGDTGIEITKDETNGVDKLIPKARLEELKKFLRDQGFSNANFTLYREKSFSRHTDERAPYQVLEVHDGNHHLQFAVCDFYGYSTYIIRNPYDFTGDKKIEIADLKADPNVYQIKYVSFDQWTRRIREYAFTPAEELREQLKTKIGWAKRGPEICDSLAMHYLETGQVPHSSDNTIVEHGNLAGKTTWRRMAAAIRGGRVFGLESFRTFNDVLAHMLGDDFQPQPAARRKDATESIKEPPVLPFDARDVFNRAVLYIRDTRQVPEDNTEFERSLQAEKVSGLADIVGEDAPLITSMEDFLIAAGLADKKDGYLIPASPAIIHQLARLISAPTQP